jgi:hypothetical protein
VDRRSPITVAVIERLSV